jgi:hypothetical protein
MAKKKNYIASSSMVLGRITAREVSINTDTSVIAITEDKLKLALIERRAILESRNAWIAPFGIFISILVTIVTTDFRKFLIAAAVWEAIFYIALLFFFGWFLCALIRRPKNKSIDEFIQHIKK